MLCSSREYFSTLYMYVYVYTYIDVYIYVSTKQVCFAKTLKVIYSLNWAMITDIPMNG